MLVANKSFKFIKLMIDQKVSQKRVQLTVFVLRMTSINSFFHDLLVWRSLSEECKQSPFYDDDLHTSSFGRSSL